MGHALIFLHLFISNKRLWASLTFFVLSDWHINIFHAIAVQMLSYAGDGSVHRKFRRFDCSWCRMNQAKTFVLKNFIWKSLWCVLQTKNSSVSHAIVESQTPTAPSDRIVPETIGTKPEPPTKIIALSNIWCDYPKKEKPTSQFALSWHFRIRLTQKESQSWKRRESHGRQCIAKYKKRGSDPICCLFQPVHSSTILLPIQCPKKTNRPPLN
jgi:hypothetical protein